jgi:outer membrane protein assembly factor BamB
MAVNAARAMLTDEDRSRIELLIVGSESGVDSEKPMSTWVQRYLGLTPHCRNFEVKHACYGGTAGLRMALGWVASGMAHGAKAPVISTPVVVDGRGVVANQNGALYSFDAANGQDLKTLDLRQVGDPAVVKNLKVNASLAAAGGRAQRGGVDLRP